MSDLEEFLGVSGTAVRHSIGICCCCKELVYENNWKLKKLVPCGTVDGYKLGILCDPCAQLEENYPSISHYEAHSSPGDYPGMESSEGWW